MDKSFEQVFHKTEYLSPNSQYGNVLELNLDGLTVSSVSKDVKHQTAADRWGTFVGV